MKDRVFFMESNELFVKANKEYEKNNFAKAFELFMQCAKEGDTDAMLRLASMYTCGEGVTCDYNKAVYWEKTAVKAGNISALTNLGITYRIVGNMEESKACFEKALIKGDVEAALHLAKLYIISDKEVDKVKDYLNIVLSGQQVCDESVTEAQFLLKKISEK